MIHRRIAVAFALSGALASQRRPTSSRLNAALCSFNGITDKYLLVIEGKCSTTNNGNQLTVTCKTGPNEFRKHFLGLSDNVSYFTEQLDDAKVGKYHYRVIFRPESIVPDVDRP